MSKQLTLEQKFERLDAVAAKGALDVSGNNFSAALQTATAIHDLRELLTPEVMAPIMDLQGSKLGFLTDRSGAGKKPYPMETVRDCAIEMTLRGIPMVGNCWNIIAGNAYVTKEGLTYLLKSMTDLTDLRISIGVPRVPKTREAEGTLVPVAASWKFQGRSDAIEETLIPVRVNSGAGVDNIKGKAERKLRKMVYDRVTGSALSDGDATDAPKRLDTTSPETLPNDAHLATTRQAIHARQTIWEKMAESGITENELLETIAKIGIQARSIDEIPDPDKVLNSWQPMIREIKKGREG